MVTWLVIADDLTGAIEAGAVAASKGIRCIVSANPDLAIHSLDDATELVVINTESRHLPPAQAAELVVRVARHFFSAGVNHIFKKTDSTLRGNIGAELHALQSVRPNYPVWFVPAFPEAGRTTRGGVHFVNNVPVHQSSFALDPRSPVRTSHVPTLMAQQTLLPSSSVTLDRAASAASGASLQVLDCSTNQELNALAQWLFESGNERWSAGSVAILDELLSLHRRYHPPQPAAPVSQPLLLVNGSLHENSLAQLRWACAHGFAPLPISAHQLFDTNTHPDLIAQAAQTLRAQGTVALFTVDRRMDAAAFVDATAPWGVTPDTVHDRCAEQMGLLVRGVLDRLMSAQGCGLIVFGGDTTAAVLKALACDRIEPQSVLQPGLARATLPQRPDCPAIVVKAGGFGNEALIGDVVLKLRNR
jgi:uncharacterized protein YgbK (DUF1537 family)